MIKKVYNDSEDLKETVYYISDEFLRIVNSSGTSDFTYVKHEGVRVAELKPDSSKIYIHSDHLGSTSLVTDSNGIGIENSSYSPYGKILEGGNASRYSYTGKEYDSTSEDYDFHARKYDADIAKFMSPDDKIQNKYDSRDLNHYSYSRNNPYRYTDPDGRDAQELDAERSFHRVVMITNERGSTIFSFAPEEGKGISEPGKVESYGGLFVTEEQAISQYEQATGQSLSEYGERIETGIYADIVGIGYAQTQQSLAESGELNYELLWGKHCRNFDKEVIAEIKKKEKEYLMNQLLLNSVSLILGKGDGASGGGSGGGTGMPNMENILKRIREEYARRNPPPPGSGSSGSGTGSGSGSGGSGSGSSGSGSSTL